ncbi:TonB C-terminal domain-containing protein [Helicobacter sp. MIT 11-5569]|uniref:energy transducer TonB n=1 Tax=Helicobacter sp. MIT 11-5569 TaxID=1548151 RepID=UPI00051F97EA|nr:energy transducer TonB [Helicobacter sp. MIT 11-5569]TLD85120.1 TonB C-terminal domain-containing protein [Helicobacter sp. MIT 11-5569]
MAKIILFFTSGGLSVFCYASIIVLLLWRFYEINDTPKAYTTYKETTFNISLIEESQPKNQIKVTQKRVEKKVKDIPIKKESASVSPNAGAGINDLFKQVESKVPVKSTKPPSQNDKIAKNKKAKKSAQNENLADELEKIMANLDTQKTLSFTTPKGEYDAFYAKVHEILAQNWNPMRTSREHFAEVAITIDAQGRFSYVIVKKSGDLEFDNALSSFLDIMRSQEFPPYEGGNSTKIMVTFKTEV